MDKYLCLAFYEPEKMNALPPSERQAIISQCPPKDAQLKATGGLRISASLDGPGGTFQIRPRGGKARVVDGPYTEAKEVVGGVFLIEAADREEAIRIACQHPAATLGEEAGWGIEVHPIGFFEQYFAAESASAASGSADGSSR